MDVLRAHLGAALRDVAEPDAGLVAAELRAVARVEAQLNDFIRRGVSDALANALVTVGALTQDRILGFVDGVYEAAFEMLQTLGEATEAA